MRDPHAEWDASCCHRIDALGVSPESPERFPVSPPGVSYSRQYNDNDQMPYISDSLEVGFRVRAGALCDPLPL